MMNLENDLEYFKIMIDMAKDEEHCGDWCSVSQHIRPYLFAENMKKLGWKSLGIDTNKCEEHFVKDDWELWHSWDSYYGTNKITAYNKYNN